MLACRARAPLRRACKDAPLTLSVACQRRFLRFQHTPLKREVGGGGAAASSLCSAQLARPAAAVPPLQLDAVREGAV